MKDVYIIYTNNCPENNREIFDLVVHFCREHDLYYALPDSLDDTTINIEGENYSVCMQEEGDSPAEKYWAIYCLLKRQMYLFQQISKIKAVSEQG